MKPIKKVTVLVLLLCIIVVSLLFIIIYGKLPYSDLLNEKIISFLNVVKIRIELIPSINVTLNALSSIFLLLGIFFIQKRRLSLHKLFMLLAFLSSSFFLIFYLIYHQIIGHAVFINQNLRMPYLIILITHIIASIISFPLIFITIIMALKNLLNQHKKIAKITFPIWLYTSLTGIIIYIFVKFFNNMV